MTFGVDYDLNLFLKYLTRNKKTQKTIQSILLVY